MRRPKVIVWEGDRSNVIFQLGSLSYDLREDQIFTYDSGSGATRYKVESAELTFESWHADKAGPQFREPILWVGVSEWIAP